MSDPRRSYELRRQLNRPQDIAAELRDVGEALAGRMRFLGAMYRNQVDVVGLAVGDCWVELAATPRLRVLVALTPSVLVWSANGSVGAL